MTRKRVKRLKNQRSGPFRHFFDTLSDFWGISGLGGVEAPAYGDCKRNAFIPLSGPEKGVITKGVFSLEKSLESLKSLDSLESLENGRNLLSCPQSGGSLETLESLNSLESLENGLC